MWPPLAASINMVEPSCDDQTTRLEQVATQRRKEESFSIGTKIYFESVCWISPVSQEQLHHSQMSPSTSQGHHCVIIVGCGSVHVSTWSEVERNAHHINELDRPSAHYIFSVYVVFTFMAKELLTFVY